MTRFSTRLKILSGCAALAIASIAYTRLSTYSNATDSEVAYDPSGAHFNGQSLSAQANLSILQARDIAVKVRVGEVVDQELEQERGGSGLRYSFDIRQNNETFEVGIDAKDGTILENGPAPVNED